MYSFLVEQLIIIFLEKVKNIMLENENIAQCEVGGLPKDHFQVPVAHIVLEEN